MKTEIDLHGYQVVEAIDIFIRHYNANVKQGNFSSISVIHGYGSTGDGCRIKTALTKLLETNEDSLTCQKDIWNPGKTIVHPQKALPAGAGIISSEILEYCTLQRTESKVLGKLRRFGDLNVKNTLRRLVKQGTLCSARKGRHTVYKVK